MEIKFNILLIDDEQDVRESIRDRIMESLPLARCSEAKNGSEGLRKMQNQRFDLVITDLGLPIKDGNTVIKEAQDLPLDLRPKRFMIISGQSNPDATPTKFGKVEFYSKPIHWDIFLGSVNALFNGETKPESSAEPKKPGATLDVEFINPFIEATLSVLQITAGVQAEKKGVSLRTASQTSSGDISSIIAMNSQKYLGSMAISFDEKCFLAIVNNMLGENYNTINAENQDAASELCNQIFGSAKKVLNEKGHSIQPALPTIITGKSHHIKHTAAGPVVRVQFLTPFGPFTIEAVTEKRES